MASSGNGILIDGLIICCMLICNQGKYIIMVQFLMGVGVVGKPYMFAC